MKGGGHFAFLPSYRHRRDDRHIIAFDPCFRDGASSCFASAPGACDDATGTSFTNLLASVDPTFTFADANVVATPSGVYEPVMPSTETLLGMGLIVVLCTVVAWVWQNQVVPTARTNLAISKKRGPVKDYLDELRASDPADSTTLDTVGEKETPNNNNVTTMSAANTLANETLATASNRQQERTLTNENRAFERWLFTDWLRDNKSERQPGRQKEPALPILKDAKWNSGDNPVLAATLLIGLGVVFTSVTERIAFLVGASS